MSDDAWIHLNVICIVINVIGFALTQSGWFIVGGCFALAAIWLLLLGKEIDDKNKK